MDKRILVPVLAIILIGAIFLGYFLGNKKGVNPKTAADSAGSTASSTTRTVIPTNVSAPGVTSTVSADVAKPVNVVSSAPGVTAQIRSFNISVNNNQFSPSTIIVNFGDTVHITFTAQDKNYDFTQPDWMLKANLPQGKPVIAEFGTGTGTSADIGKYTFYCASCGGPDKGPVGYIIVTAR